MPNSSGHFLINKKLFIDLLQYYLIKISQKCYNGAKASILAILFAAAGSHSHIKKTKLYKKMFRTSNMVFTFPPSYKGMKP